MFIVITMAPFYLLHITSSRGNDAFNGEMTDNSTPLDGVRLTSLKTDYCGACHRPFWTVEERKQ
nr:hypothetical protein [Providencia rettgeri]